MTRLLIWIAGILIAAAQVLLAQEPGTGNDYSIDVWQVEHGLPDSSVTSIAQTSDGYLWVGTFAGLARFDGVRFEIFDSRIPGLENERVLRLFGDEDGALWVSMESGNLARYAAGRFVSYGSREGWPMEPCRVITSEHEHHILFFTRSGGLFGFENGRFAKILPSEPTSGPAAVWRWMAVPEVRFGLSAERHWAGSTAGNGSQ